MNKKITIKEYKEKLKELYSKEEISELMMKYMEDFDEEDMIELIYSFIVGKYNSNIALQQLEKYKDKIKNNEDYNIFYDSETGNEIELSDSQVDMITSELFEMDKYEIKEAIVDFVLGNTTSEKWLENIV